MTADYWRERWREGRTGFHLADVNPLLIEHRAVFSEATRVLVPLCGKSADLEWLVTQAYEVVGVELVELAAQAFFAERGFAPTRRTDGGFVVYEHGSLAIWVGDFFATTGAQLGMFDAAYDRAAMIALPAELRNRYTSHLQTLLTPKARLLLITLHFDLPGGPPFSVPPEEVSGAFADAEVELLASLDSSADRPSAVDRGATFESRSARPLRSDVLLLLADAWVEVRNRGAFQVRLCNRPTSRNQSTNASPGGWLQTLHLVKLDEPE